MGKIQQDEIPDDAFKVVDMTEDMKTYAYRKAVKGLSKFSIEKDIAQYLKEDFDKNFGINWHCIVGKSFGSFVTHDSKHYVYFYIGEISFLLFKFG